MILNIIIQLNRLLVLNREQKEEINEI